MSSFVYKEKKFLIGLFILHTIWWVVALLVGNMNTGDSMEYEQQAINIAEHGSWYSWYWDQPMDHDYDTWRPPLYGTFIFVCKLVTSSTYFYLTLQSLMNIGIWMLVLYLSLSLPIPFNPRAPLLLGITMFPNGLMIVNSISADTIFLLFIVVGLFSFWKFLETKNTTALAVVHGAFLLALFTKPVLLYFWIPLLIYNVYLYFKLSKNKALIFLPLLFPLFIGVWSARNYVVTGHWHYSSVSHINLMYYNSNYPLKHLFGDDYADSVSATILKQSKQFPDYHDQAVFIEQKAWEIIKEYPWTYSYCHMKGMMLLFLEPGRSDWIHFFNTPPPDEESFTIAFEKNGASGFQEYAKKFSLPILLAMAVLFLWNATLLFFTIVGFWKYRRHPYIQFLFLFFSYIVLVTGTVGCARYKMTIYPILLLVGLLGLIGMNKNKVSAK